MWTEVFPPNSNNWSPLASNRANLAPSIQPFFDYFVSFSYFIDSSHIRHFIQSRQRTTKWYLISLMRAMFLFEWASKTCWWVSSSVSRPQLRVLPQHKISNNWSCCPQVNLTEWCVSDNSHKNKLSRGFIDPQGTIAEGLRNLWFLFLLKEKPCIQKTYVPSWGFEFTPNKHFFIPLWDFKTIVKRMWI